MGKIFFTRHGETEWNIVRRMQGQDNSPLTQLGKKQASWLAKRLENTNIDIIYSSNLNRALHTAEIIRDKKEIDIIPCNELREIYLGSWQGCLATDIENEFPEKHRCFWYEPESYKPIDGETFEELSIRVGGFIDDIIKKHPDDDILIVAHAIVLKALFNHINNKGNIKTLWDGPNLKPTCLSLAHNNKGNMTIEYIGDTSHYLEVNSTGGWFLDEK